jgi:hypothetical protein
MIMADQELTELTILLRIVEVLERRMQREHQSAPENIVPGYTANVINNFIASSPNLAFARSGEAVIMGDQYTTGQAGAVGPHSSAHNMSFNQVWNQVESAIDLPALADELEQVRIEMRRIAGGEPEQDLSVAEIAQAEMSAKSGNGPSVIEHLRSAGKWALDVAKEVGAEVAVAAIKSATGL